MTSDTPSLLYIHGLNSSAPSRKACQLSSLLKSLGLVDRPQVPAPHHHPRQAMLQREAARPALG
ncbi:esterase, partial [Pseudomonas syringae]